MINVLLFLCLLLIAPTVSAEEKVRLDEIVVTASRIEEPLGETTSGVILITQEDIQKMNVSFVPDILRKLPEVHVIQNGGTGKVASVLLRGGSSSHTLVLIDGIRMNSTTTGSFDFSGISVDDIERIEIVKGPLSTIYGSDAMAGVISIITKKGTGRFKSDVSLEAGSKGTVNPTAGISGGYKTVHYRLTGKYFQTDGISAADAGTGPDGYRKALLSGKLGFSPSENLVVEFTGSYSYDRSELDGFDFFSSKAVDDGNFVQRGHHGFLSGKAIIHASDMWTQTVSTSLAKDSLKFRDPDTVFNNAETMTSINTVDWQHDFSPFEFYSVVAGFEYREEKGDSEGNFDKSISNYALYLTNRLKLLEKLFLVTVGVRCDDRDISGSKATYRFGATYTIPNAGATFRASYGTGFRAPALNELFFPFYGNPDLEPEETTSWEAGFSKEFFAKRLQISMTYFDQEYENLIWTDPKTFTADNIKDACVKGLETSAAIQVNEHINIKAGYTYLDTEDRQTGKQLPLRPKDKLNLTADLSIRNFMAVADYTFIGERFDSAVKRTLSSYSIVNMSGSYEVSRELTLFARIENLFDEEYEEIGSFNTPGISFYGGIRASF
jgi:vitamin B12 transporter